MPRAFVLSGGSRSQLGLLEQAHALGHEVCVVDGSPDAPLLADADYGIVRSFADVGGVLGDLEAQGIEPIAVAKMGSDQAVLPTAQLAGRLGLREAEGALPERPRGDELRGGRAGLPPARRAGGGQAGRRLRPAGSDRG